MEIVYETTRLQLCVFNEAHLKYVKEFWGDKEVMDLCNGATAHHLLPQIIEGYRNCHLKYNLSVYAVKEKKSNIIIGAAGFNITNTAETVELIYHFSKKYWGKGFATEAAQACIEIAKHHGMVRIIHASTDPQNKDSLKILEKVGFIYTGMKWFEDTKQEEPFYKYKIQD
ncbi:acetyltransferase [Bacillus manliponensis]|uniref:Acetyltransferase n=1 Tax=Bacillus manliponensis TaxID=574376 RepID=A0A073K687_9BACI|nr:GNAT family N-acetyltransferase [Bacillus manliponensis]KEK17798.1 acetyltransferase [Bacillus manliponensis]